MTLFYVLIVLDCLVFGAFYLLYYNQPAEDNPAFNAPMMTGVLIVFILILLAITLITCIGSIVLSRKTHGMRCRRENGVPVTKIHNALIALVIAIPLICYFTANDQPIATHGEFYGNTFMLKLSDMFVNTSLIFLSATIVTVLFGYTRYIRKKNDVD
ncbi:MAG: hypothetical protein ACI350_03380 [Prevotella sp.]